MWPVAGFRPPSGTYAITGATIALPSARAIRSDSAFTRTLCLPSAMCGPFCSVPPIGTMIVVFPAWINARNSVHVSSSRKTASGGSANAGVTARRQSTAAQNAFLDVTFLPPLSYSPVPARDLDLVLERLLVSGRHRSRRRGPLFGDDRAADHVATEKRARRCGVARAMRSLFTSHLGA